MDYHHSLDSTILSVLNERAKQLEDALSMTVLAYVGSIHPGFLRKFRDAIEMLRSRATYADSIGVLLRTGGGSAEMAESMATILRNHFAEVNFIVPDIAMSAGTILCMSGDRIYMDYSSALGPIDPQVISPDGTGYIAAMGYLDKVEEITAKSARTQADVVFLRSIDLGRLALYEQARSFSIDLLKEWLVEFKFKNWTLHRTTNAGQPVTPDEKQQRAEAIAVALSDHKRWRSHGRALDIKKLVKLGLQIDDYSKQDVLLRSIRAYNDPLSEYVERTGKSIFIHSHILNGEL
ncbi:MAG: serine dehydrogenasease [Candidatus Kapabacteria bacterium]|nr:serine dehydrogenasease [Candidatus Kapabacteria bacterium]